MSKAENDDIWFDVLTGRKDPRNREEQIFSELRTRVLKDAASEDFQLSELDLQRGKKTLRAATKSKAGNPIQPFLSGLAAGIVAVGIGTSVFLTQFSEPDIPITKDLPIGLTPSITQEWPTPESLSSSIPELIGILSSEGTAFELNSDGSQIVLSFKTSAPVPDPIASWLEDNGIESLPVTTYRLSVTTKTAQQP